MVILRKEKKRKYRIKKLILIIALLIPIIIFQVFLIQVFENLRSQYINYLESPDRVQGAVYVPLNTSILQQAEQRYEALLDYYHIPFNLSGHNYYFPLCDAGLAKYNNTIFNTTAEYLAVADPLNFSSPYNQIIRYAGLEHNIGTTGVYLIGQAFKYAVGVRENNNTLKSQALNRMKQGVDAIYLFFNVTGQKFLPRWAAPNTTLARNLFGEYYFTTKYNGYHLIYPVDYNGDIWYLVTGTSKDMHLGVLSGLAFVYLFCDDIGLRSKITIIVDGILTYLEQTDWRFIDADGKTHFMGAEIRTGQPLTDPIFILAFLQVGRLVHYDRWNPVYLRYLFDEGLIQEVGMQEKVGIYDIVMLTDTYFDINLQTKVVLLAAFFETIPEVRAIYLKDLEELNRIWHYHRNAHFDLMYLVSLIPKVEGQIIPSPSFTSFDQIPLSVNDLSYYSNDITDCLMRFALTKYPKRNFQNPVLDYKTSEYFEPIYNNYSYYPDIGLFKPEKENIFVNLLNTIIGEPTWVNVSLPLDMRATCTFLWEQSPFEPQPGGNGLWQSMPADYLTSYWMARYIYVF
ncbi:MAG TPA: hypothetical protein VMV49_13915 [Candidatus Deferrimicrobium sp.]|nr:hypothetical protein [Candidatus Deferrimicrobium sp.]